MTSHDQMLGGDSLANSSPFAQRASRFGLWSGRLLSFLAGVLVVAIAGIWSFWGKPPTLPAIPEINVDGFDLEIADAIERARHAVEKDPRSKTAWGELAMVLHAHAFEDQAVTGYVAASMLDPKNYLWPYLQGIVVHKSPAGPEAALPCFKRAVQLVPAEPLPRLWLAEMLLELGRLDEAAKEYDEILSSDPGNERAEFGLGKLAVARQQFPTALSYLDSVSQNPSARRSSCALRAVIYERLGRREPAERERKQLAKLPPDSSWPDDAAELVFERRVGLAARLERVRRYGVQGRVADAIFLLQDMAESYPGSDETWFQLGNFLFYAQFRSSNDPIGAERALKKSIKLAPTKAEYRLTLGTVELAQRKYEEAAETYRKAIELSPEEWRAHFGLGECLQALGDFAGAAAAYRQTLECEPNHTLAKERLAKLTENP